MYTLRAAEETRTIPGSFYQSFRFLCEFGRGLLDDLTIHGQKRKKLTGTHRTLGCTRPGGEPRMEMAGWLYVMEMTMLQRGV